MNLCIYFETTAYNLELKRAINSIYVYLYKISSNYRYNWKLFLQRECEYEFYGKMIIFLHHTYLLHHAKQTLNFLVNIA